MARNALISREQYRPKYLTKALSTLLQKSAIVAESGETTATVAEFGDSRTFLRQCGQAFSFILPFRIGNN